MNKIKIIFLVFFIAAFLVTGCSEYTDTIWTGSNYRGTVDDGDIHDGVDSYYDLYLLGWPGLWKIEFESEDGIYLDFIVVDCAGKRVLSKGTSTSFNIKTSMELAPFKIYVKISETNALWIQNRKEADYAISMTLL